MPGPPEVEVTRHGGVLTITLNRPDVLNALNRAVHEGLHAALVEARDDESIRAVVITGAGRGFCVGQDLREFSSGAGDVAQNLRDNFHRNVLAIRSLEKPVVAAVNGPAAGAGMSLALACDLRIAADSAGFVPAFVNIGLVPDSGGTWLARRLLGGARAFEWLTSGRRLGAEEAHAWGLVSEVVPGAVLAERAQEIARSLALMPTRALGETKRLLDAAETSTLEQQLELEARTQAELTQTHDFREGVAAFLEKRESRFTGAGVAWPHPVALVNRDDRRRWRLTAALRPLLALPHLLVLGAWGLVATAVAIVGWVVALARGRTPAGLHGWLVRYVRYATHVGAYVHLLAEPFPGFRGRESTYPVDLRVAAPQPQPRWKIAVRLPLALPALVLSYALGVVLVGVSVLCWVSAVAVARVPAGAQQLGAYCLRYHAQVLAYLLLLTDRYPSLAGSEPVTPASSSAAAGTT